ncbi:MAG: hypothetical protein MJY92_01595 [Bacteroidales bacterium]|nr:hypothetical protein [Bacteroidales bacterium]
MITGIFRDIADLLFPRYCPVCGNKLLTDEHILCERCTTEMPLTYFWTMGRHDMSESINEKIEKLRARDNVSYYEPFCNACALYFYKKGYRNISRQVKYHGRYDIGFHMGRELGLKMADTKYSGDIDLVVPVPLHWSRKLSRGYNQAAIIAEGLAGALGVECNCKLLKRSRRTKSQARIGVNERDGNVAGVFAMDCRQAEKLLLTGVRHILLVDDVFTTGATLSEVQHCIRQGLHSIDKKLAGSVKISVATLACVGE